MIKRIIFSLFIFLFLLTSKIYAAGEFQADYNVNYAISPIGTTIVTQNVTLTNKLTNLYPKRYNITIDSDKIKNVIATDEVGAITPTIALKDGKTEIGIDFNTQNAGVGKKTLFTLRYEHGDVAHKNGRIWEILIPGVENDQDLGNYTTTLSVPSSFGPVAYLNPRPNHGAWTKEQMVQGGIVAAYGDEQVFALTLSYYLENNSVASNDLEVALPPDTAFQSVTIDSISPQPKTVIRDADGNWLARYNVNPGQKLEITANLTVRIYLTPKKDWVAESINPDDYLSPSRYWEVYDARITKLAQTYRTPRQIYDYVVTSLSYVYQRVTQNPTRLGAVGVLVNPKSAICMEFTDLFIAIARAAGIPAREVVGYAHTTNSKLRPLSLVSDVLHAWPEYYDSDRNIWVPVDPTWANTTGGVDYFNTLDFNHIVFAIHGKSSELPYPAGFYRNAAKSGKDVQVSFVETKPDEITAGPLTITIDFPDKVTGGIRSAGHVYVKNESGNSISQANISVESKVGNINLSKVEKNIPPYASVDIPIEIKTTSFSLMEEGRLIVNVDGQIETHSFIVRPIYWIFLPYVAVVAGGMILFVLWKYLRR